jgi:hypothetical protein
MKSIQELAQWVIDNRYPKSENNKISDFEMYNFLIENFDKLNNQKKIFEVAVLAPKYEYYYDFIKSQNNKNEKYFFVDSINKVIGKSFDRIEKLHNYYYIEDIDEILDYLKKHLRSN